MKIRLSAILAVGLAGMALALAVGCAQSKIAGDGRAVDAPDRIPSLVRLAQGGGHTASTQGGTVSREDAKGLAELVWALDDDDPAVRLFAAEALRERTGLAFGYRYYDSAQRRWPAVRAWRDWLDEQAPGSQAPAPGTQDPASPTPPVTPNTASAPE